MSRVEQEQRRPRFPVRVEKIWGAETWYYNGDYCGKRLVVAEDRHCSIHWHIVKHETFLVENGRILLELFRRDGTPITRFILNRGASYVIEPGLAHRFTAIGGNASIIEFSTHHEDDDSIRIQENHLWKM